MVSDCEFGPFRFPLLHAQHAEMYHVCVLGQKSQIEQHTDLPAIWTGICIASVLDVWPPLGGRLMRFKAAFGMMSRLPRDPVRGL
jgi:hypothetical protein